MGDPDQASQTVSPDFNDTSADLRLSSSDDVIFYIHSYYLKASRFVL